jgi:hypothetical protein
VQILLIALTLAAGITTPQDRPLPVPSALIGYGRWRAASPEPQPVPYELWIQCVHPTAEQEARAASQLGPHNLLYVRVFANQVAAPSFFNPNPTAFPEGSIIVKEKSGGGSGPPIAVAAMIKGKAGSHPSSSDWQFQYISAKGAVVATGACQGCHSKASADFVFRSSASIRP